MSIVIIAFGTCQFNIFHWRLQDMKLKPPLTLQKLLLFNWDLVHVGLDIKKRLVLISEPSQFVYIAEEVWA